MNNVRNMMANRLSSGRTNFGATTKLNDILLNAFLLMIKKMIKALKRLFEVSFPDVRVSEIFLSIIVQVEEEWVVSPVG